MKNTKNIKFRPINTISKLLFIVFFCFLIAIYCYNRFSISNRNAINSLVNQKIDKVLYRLFTDLIDNKVINNNLVQDILIINKNNRGEIIMVDYNIEKTYEVLSEISKILKSAISDFENGKILVDFSDNYMKSKNKKIIFEIPLFIGSKNVFLNNLGPKIPVIINFNENLLTNIKTKVTNYGFNNALLEVYVTVELQKLIITPISDNLKPFNYNILISAVVINGRVPEFYGGLYEANSNLFNVPIE